MTFNKLAIALAVAGMSTGAYATNGMNMEGYGPIATSMGGASMAYDNGDAGMINNPATLGLMSEGNRVDVAVGDLGPDVVSKMPGMPDAKSHGTSYIMPGLGWVRKADKLSYGIGLMAQGGMGTKYGDSTFLSGYQSMMFAATGGAMGSAGATGLGARSQLQVGRVLLPLAYNVNQKLTVGGSIDFVWAGLNMQYPMSGNMLADMFPNAYNPYATHSFGTVSGSMVDTFGGALGPNPGQVGDVNYGNFDFNNNNILQPKTNSTGYAGTIGFTYQASPTVTIGGVYHSKTHLGDLTGDATVTMNVAVNGMGNVSVPISGQMKIVDFQWPDTYGLGLAWKATDKLMVAADYKRINWSNVMKDFKMSFTASATQSNPMANGFGLGGTTLNATLYQNWKDQDVFELGLAYQMNDALTLRGGVNVANNPVPDQYMNPLFPAIEKSHFTAGFGYAFSRASDLNMSVTYAPKVSQTNSVAGVSVDHSQTSWQLMYSYKF